MESFYAFVFVWEGKNKEVKRAFRQSFFVQSNNSISAIIKFSKWLLFFLIPPLFHRKKNVILHMMDGYAADRHKGSENKLSGFMRTNEQKTNLQSP